MTITKELLKELYQEYNAKYFDNQLGKCEFSLFTKNMTTLGSYLWREDKKGRPKDKIWIGTCIYWNEEILKRVLIHEMIHMYVHRIEGHKYDGLLGHGRRFRRQCKRIREQYGIETLKLPKVEFINKEHEPKLWERVVLWIIDR